MKKNTSRLFTDRRFLPLFLTQFLGVLNDNAFKNAFLIWFTFEMSDRVPMDEGQFLALAAGIFILPFFLFSATAGQMADRYEKSNLATIIKMVEIVLMILCFTGFYMQSVWGLLIILFFMGMQSTFFGPIKYSLLPEHLHEDELIPGNAYVEGGTFLAILLGTIIGGIVIRFSFGIYILSAIVVVCAFVGWLASRYIPKTQVSDPSLRIGWNIIIETKNIIHYAKQEHTVWLSIIAISWFWLIGATFITQFPIYCKQVLGGNEYLVTLLLTIFSIGIGVGSILCNKLLRGEINGRLVPFGSFGISLSIFLFGLFSWLYTQNNSIDPMQVISISTFLQEQSWSIFILISLLLLSLCSGIYIVPLYAIMQHRSNQKYLSRIIAANNVMNACFMVLSSVVGIVMLSLGLNVVGLLVAIGLLNIPVYFIIRGVVKRRLQHA